MRPRQLSPTIITDKRRQWEVEMSSRVPVFRKYDALWYTKFWEGIEGKDGGRWGSATSEGREWIECNSMYPFVTEYAAQLFDPNIAVAVKRGSDLQGDATKAKLVLNEWIKGKGIAQATNQMDAMAIVYDGVAANVTIDFENPDMLQRVGLGIIPWWETMPDQDATTTTSARFAAHIYYMPLAAARVLFRDATLKGRPRPIDPYVVGSAYSMGEKSENRPDMVVRIMEVFNFVDDYYLGESLVETGGTPVPGFVPTDETPCQRGRREFYILDEGAPGDNVVRLVLPLPLRAHSTQPVSPLPILTYLSHLAYPFRGTSHIDRVVDQFREKMMIRSNYATNIRVQVPLLIGPRDMFDADARGIYRTRPPGGMMEYDQKLAENQSIGNLVMAVPSPNIPYDNQVYNQVVEKDIAGATLQAPADRAQISGGSATEVLQAAETSKSEIAILTAKRVVFLIQLFESVLAAIRTSIAAAGPDAVLHIVTGEAPHEVVIDITAADLDGNFVITLADTDSTQLARDRKFVKMTQVFTEIKPLADAIRQTDDPVAGMFFDALVECADLNLGPQFSYEAIRKMPKAAPLPESPRGPGAGSALPGQGSMPAPTAAPTPVAGETESTNGGPQPPTDQPPDNQTGVAQNATGASL
jgi:hypothetical protein